MKHHDTATDLLLAAPDQSIAWLLRLGPAETPLRAATRALELDSVPWPPIILEPPQWSMEAPDRPFPAGLARTRGTVVLADAPDRGEPPAVRFENTSPVGMEAELSLLWCGASGAWTEAAPVVMLRGSVQRAERLVGAWRLELLDALAFAAGQSVVRLLDAAWMGGANVPLAGHPLQLVFGRHARLSLMPLRAGASARLAEPLMRGDALAALTSLDGFPDSGRVQLGDEVLDYAALDREAGTLGTIAHPLARPVGAPLHSAGEPVRVIPEGGFLWLAADHPCASIGPLYADGIELAPDAWSSESVDLAGVEAQAVRMPLWPVAARYARASHRAGLRELLGVNPYLLAAESSALNPASAVDPASTASHAVLSASSGLLAFDLAPTAAQLGPLAGLWSAATLAVRYSASGAWLVGTEPIARVVRGESVVEAVIPSALTDGAARAIRELRIDLAPLFDPAAGWQNITGDPPLRIEIQFNAAGGELEFLFIHDLDIEVEHYPRLAADESREITATVAGWPDGEGEPVENPADVLSVLVAHTRFAGLSEDALDGETFDAAREACEARGATFARVIRSGTLGNLIDSAAAEASLLVRPGGEKVTLAEIKAAPWPADTIDLLDESKALDSKAGVTIENKTSVGLALLSAGDDHPFAEGDQSHPAIERLAWLTAENEAPARLARRRHAALAEPSLQYAQLYPPGAALLEPGDTALVDRPLLGLVESPHLIRSLRMEGEASVRIESRGPQSGFFVWRDEADRAFIRCIGFGGRLLFVIGGRPVASLARGGELCLLGEVREEATLDDSASAAISFDGDAIVLAVPAGDGFIPFARITPSGDLELRGTVTEEAAPLDPPTDGRVTLAEGAMILSSDGVAAAARYELPDTTLRLAGIVRENIEVY